MILPPISKTYQGKKVLDFPGCELESGTITAVIGANGSGKTTLAKVLAGIEKSDLKKPVLKDCTIGYMPQKSIAFRMSTEKNILQNGMDRERAVSLMDSLNLTGLAKSPAHKLSGGETAKMALARLLIRNYDLLILDEPSASMDMESTLAAEQLIREYCFREQSAVLVITHSLKQAQRLAGQVLFLHQGKLIESGPADKILSSPDSEETRKFLDFYGLELSI